jgi:regulator of replication initiation timing
MKNDLRDVRERIFDAFINLNQVLLEGEVTDLQSALFDQGITLVETETLSTLCKMCEQLQAGIVNLLAINEILKTERPHLCSRCGLVTEDFESMKDHLSRCAT